MESANMIIVDLIFFLLCILAPYVKLDMNPNVPGVSEQSVLKDAVFFSMHKFIGGVQTPGKIRILNNNITIIFVG